MSTNRAKISELNKDLTEPSLQSFSSENSVAENISRPPSPAPFHMTLSEGSIRSEPGLTPISSPYHAKKPSLSQFSTSAILEDIRSPKGTKIGEPMTHQQLLTYLQDEKAEDTETAEWKKIAYREVSDEDLGKFRKQVGERKKGQPGGGFCVGLGTILWGYYLKNELDNFINGLKELEAQRGDLGYCAARTLQTMIAIESSQWPSHHGYESAGLYSGIPIALNKLLQLSVSKVFDDSSAGVTCTPESFQNEINKMKIGSLLMICNVPPATFEKFYHAIHIIRLDENNFLFYDANNDPIYKLIPFAKTEASDIYKNHLPKALYGNFGISISDPNSFLIERHVFHKDETPVLDLDLVPDELEASPTAVTYNTSIQSVFFGRSKVLHKRTSSAADSIHSVYSEPASPR